MLEVMLCRRSPLGTVVPIGRSSDPVLVRLAIGRIRQELMSARHKDPLVTELLDLERKRLVETLRSEGFNVEP